MRTIAIAWLLMLLATTSAAAQSSSSGAKQKRPSGQSATAKRKKSRQTQKTWRNTSPYYQDSPDWVAKAFLPRER